MEDKNIKPQPTLKSSFKPIKRFVETCGKHPFATGLFAGGHWAQDEKSG